MEKLKIEAGKYYRTRDGKKAFVSGENPFESRSMFAMGGFVDGRGSTTWTLDGGYYQNYGESVLDLVAEWKEPKRIKGTVILWSDGAGRFVKEGDRDPFDVNGRVACIEIDVLEGQGLDGSAS